MLMHDWTHEYCFLRAGIYCAVQVCDAIPMLSAPLTGPKKLLGGFFLDR